VTPYVRNPSGDNPVNSDSNTYYAYLGASSSNPGRCGCAVLVTRGTARAHKTTAIDVGDHDDALLGAMLMALALLAPKEGPIVIVSDRRLARVIAQANDPGPVPVRVTSAREAWQKVAGARPDGSDLRLQHVTQIERRAHGPLLDEAHRLAYVAAFPSDSPAVGSSASSTPSGGGASKTP
jgi:hypothetical protein